MPEKIRLSPGEQIVENIDIIDHFTPFGKQCPGTSGGVVRDFQGIYLEKVICLTCQKDSVFPVSTPDKVRK